MTQTLVVGLPPASSPAQAEAHWWLVDAGAALESGAGADWAARLAGPDGIRRRLVGLAPAADVRLTLDRAPVPAATPRQRSSLARLSAIEASLGDAETLHAVSSIAPDPNAPLLTAVTANSAMLQWLDWAAAAGAEIDVIVPAGSILPSSDGWSAARVGAEHIVAGAGLAIPNEPALAQHLVGDAELLEIEPAEVDALVAAAAQAPPLDLRTGAFARRRGLVVDRDRIRELLLLAALITLITILWAVVSIVRLDASSDRLDAETLRVAESALGRSVSLETAEAELRQRSAGGGSSFAGLLAGLYRHLQPEAGVASNAIGYGADGTLSATLAGPSIDPINRMLVALQRDGYRITAVHRQSPDGRAMVDVTVRGAP